MSETKEIPLAAIPVTVRIKKIDLVDFKTVPLTEEQIKNLDKTKIGFELNFNIKVDQLSKEFTISNTTKFFTDETKAFYLGEIESVGIFVLENFEEIVQSHKGIPNTVLAMFVGILASTVRGFQLLKFMGTPYEGAIMPIIDLTKLAAPPLTQVGK